MSRTRASRCLWLTAPVFVSAVSALPSGAQPPLHRSGAPNGQGVLPMEAMDRISQPDPDAMPMAARAAAALRPEPTARGPVGARPAPMPMPAESDDLGPNWVRYQAGTGNIIELSDAQQAFTMAAASRVQADYDVDVARARLARALGRE